MRFNQILSITAVTFAVASISSCATSHGNKKDGSEKDKTKDEEKYPFLTRPEVRTIWVPDAIEGNRYIEKHRVFIIDKNTSWSKDNE